jgi:hypothetical protein
MVTIAFLLITAVWVSHSRINASAQLPGNDRGPDPVTVAKDLHLYSTPEEFILTWKQGATVMSETRIARQAVGDTDTPRYADLAAKIAEEWEKHGSHRDKSDRAVDRCVYHSDNQEPFREVVAVMDAIYEAKRDVVFPGGDRRHMPVFNMAFASR